MLTMVLHKTPPASHPMNTQTPWGPGGLQKRGHEKTKDRAGTGRPCSMVSLPADADPRTGFSNGKCRDKSKLHFRTLRNMQKLYSSSIFLFLTLFLELHSNLFPTTKYNSVQTNFYFLRITVHKPHNFLSVLAEGKWGPWYLWRLLYASEKKQKVKPLLANQELPAPGSPKDGRAWWGQRDLRPPCRLTSSPTLYLPLCHLQALLQPVP